MIEKYCLVTDILPDNDICNKFGETGSEIIGDFFSSSICGNILDFLFVFWREKSANIRIGREIWSLLYA